MALDPELARRVDPALSEIASRLDEASRLAADATLRLRDFGLPVPTQVFAAGGGAAGPRPQGRELPPLAADVTASPARHAVPERRRHGRRGPAAHA